MRATACACFAILCCLAGCTHLGPNPSGTASPGAAPTAPQTEATTTNSAPKAAAQSGSAATSGSAPKPATQTPAPQTKPKPSPGSSAQPPATSAAKPSQSKTTVADNAKPKAPSGNSPAKPPASVESAAPASQPAPQRQSAPAAPALDLTSLEQRLKDTHAIGVFTKLSLKNQVDDLLEEFKAFHHKQAKASLADLRQHYDLLLLKVLSLLQDGDPPLAAAISSSREAIWGILADPDKFSRI